MEASKVQQHEPTEATAAQLSQQCSNDALLQLSTEIADSNGFKLRLGLSDAEINAVDLAPTTINDIPGRFLAALKRWKSKGMFDSTATYGRLMEIARNMKDGFAFQSIQKACIKHTSVSTICSETLSLDDNVSDNVPPYTDGMPRSDSDSNVSHDSGASFDSSDQLDSLGIPCWCPCGQKSLSHILSPLRDCLAVRHSRSQSFPTIHLAAVTSHRNKKEAIKQMKQYFSFETKKLQDEFENFGNDVYLYARSIDGVKNHLKQILRLRGKVIDSDDFECLYDAVTAGANLIDYKILSSLLKWLLQGDRNNETAVKDEARNSFEKYLDAFRKFAQYRVFSPRGNILEARLPIQEVCNKLTLKIEENSKTFRVEQILQLQDVVEEILKIPEWVQLRVLRLNEGCVEIHFEVIGSFDFDLSLDQRQDLISNNITSLEYAGKMHYCCCELLEDEKSCEVVKKIYDNVYQSDCQTDEINDVEDEEDEHHPNCIKENETNDCHLAECAYCETKFNCCLIKSHSLFCEGKDSISSTDSSDFESSAKLQDCHKTCVAETCSLNHENSLDIEYLYVPTVTCDSGGPVTDHDSAPLTDDDARFTETLETGRCNVSRYAEPLLFAHELDLSLDNGAPLDDSSISSLRVKCKCPCGRTDFTHILYPPPDCLANRHSDAQSFPELDLKASTDKKKAQKQLKFKLVEQTRSIKEEYMTLRMAVYNYAISKEIIKRAISLNEQVVETSDIELYEKFAEGANFINYDILVQNLDILKTSDTGEENELGRLAKAAAERYEASFKEYAQQRVVLVPTALQGANGRTNSVYKELKIKVEEEFCSFEVNRLLYFKKVVKTILKLPPPVNLRITSVREGCVEICFEVIGLLADETFHLTTEQKQEMLANNITLLEYDGQVPYCCCDFLGDEKSRGTIKKLYEALPKNQSHCSKDVHQDEDDKEQYIDRSSCLGLCAVSDPEQQPTSQEEQSLYVKLQQKSLQTLSHLFMSQSVQHATQHSELNLPNTLSVFL